MKKETALSLIKSGNLSEDEQKLVLAEVAEADKVDVQKAIDALKAPESVDVSKLAESVATEIVKAIEPKLTAIADSLKKTVETLEKLSVAKAPETNPEEDPEITDPKAVQALLDEEMK